MPLTSINHLAMVTDDLVKTTRFYRDLLGLELFLGKGVNGFRHYIFRLGPNQLAFFEYPKAGPREARPQGERRGFDHVSFTVGSKVELFGVRDRLRAAGFAVSEVIDYGMVWSFHSEDP
ncbi:MAG: VOC family protein, partial [Alphaproteobacteria bacterium]|nr:VOC family protein [Alphaproteobacteria bacterium]